MVEGGGRRRQHMFAHAVADGDRDKPVGRWEPSLLNDAAQSSERDTWKNTMAACSHAPAHLYLRRWSQLMRTGTRALRTVGVSDADIDDLPRVILHPR